MRYFNPHPFAFRKGRYQRKPHFRGRTYGARPQISQREPREGRPRGVPKEGANSNQEGTGQADTIPCFRWWVRVRLHWYLRYF